MTRRPNGEKERDLIRLKGILHHPSTMEEITNKIGTNKRTVYRYLDELKTQGIEVIRVGLERPTKYKII